MKNSKYILKLQHWNKKADRVDFAKKAELCGITSFKEASDICIQFIEKHGIKENNWAGGNIFKNNDNAIFKDDDRLAFVTVDGIIYDSFLWRKAFMVTMAQCTSKAMGKDDNNYFYGALLYMPDIGDIDQALGDLEFEKGDTCGRI